MKLKYESTATDTNNVSDDSVNYMKSVVENYTFPFSGESTQPS